MPPPPTPIIIACVHSFSFSYSQTQTHTHTHTACADICAQAQQINIIEWIYSDDVQQFLFESTIKLYSDDDDDDDDGENDDDDDTFDHCLPNDSPNRRKIG